MLVLVDSDSCGDGFCLIVLANSVWVFLVVLTAGFAYEWKKGAMDWE